MLTKAQVECQESLDSCEKCLVIKSIRSGKTYCILDYAQKRKLIKVLWVVPYTVNINGVQEEVEKWNIKLNIEVICYQSLKKYTNKDFDLVVLDEIHRLTLPYYEYISQIKYNKIIGMTGTYPKGYSKIKTIEELLGLKVVYTYSVKDAVKDQNVAPYKINIIKKVLSTKRDYVITYKDKKTKQEKSFTTSEYLSYVNLCKRIEESYGMRQTMLTFERLRFLNTLPSSIDFIKSYISLNKSKRFLIFVATQVMAEECSNFCYYGGKSDKYFKLFQEEKINHLVLVEKATVGVTYQNLDQVLLTNINSSNASVQQKIFRAILFRPDYEAKIDILINENTEQVAWLNNSIKDII